MYYENLIPESEISFRIKKFQKKLEELDIPVAIIYYPVNCYYFSGALQDEILIIYADKDPVLLVRRDIERACKDSSIKNIYPLNSLKILKEYIKEKKIGIEFNNITYSEFLKFKAIFQDANFVNISEIIDNQRAIKSEYEISLMRKAGEIAKKVYIQAANFLKEGITEIEFAGIMEKIARKYGHEGVLRTGTFRFESYTSHIMSGVSGTYTTKTATPTGGIGLSPAFPCGASFKKIKKGEPILVDFGICYMGYQVDETRMFCIGEPDDEFQDYYNKILIIENEIYKNLKPDVNGAELFSLIYNKAKDLEIEDYFLGYKEKFNFIGHGIGLHTSEFPIIAKNIDIKIKENMTIAFEPKIVIPGKYGLGVENTIVVRKEKLEILTEIPGGIICV